MKLMGFKTCFVFLLCQAVNTEAEDKCIGCSTCFYFIFAFFEVEFIIIMSNFAKSYDANLLYIFKQMLQCYLVLKINSTHLQ